MFTIDDVAKMLSVTKRVIVLEVERGKLKGFKVGGSWRFFRSDLAAYLGGEARLEEILEAQTLKEAA